MASVLRPADRGECSGSREASRAEVETSSTWRPVHAEKLSVAPRRRSRAGFVRALRHSLARLAEFVLEHANAGNLDPRDVARDNTLRRLEADPDARRRTRSDDVAGH